MISIHSERMTPRTIQLSRGALSALCCLAGIGMLGGCGGGDYELSPNVMRVRPASIEVAQLAAGPVKIPAREPFNVLLPTVAYDGGGNAKATTDQGGRAACEAICKGLGTATGEFRIGYKFAMPQGSERRALVKLDITGKHTFHRVGKDSGGNAMLWMFIKDSAGIVLAQETLLNVAGSMSEGTFDLPWQFDIDLKPDRTYYIILAGRAGVHGEANGEIETRIEVSSVTVEIENHPDGPRREIAGESTPAS